MTLESTSRGYYGDDAYIDALKSLLDVKDEENERLRQRVAELEKQVKVQGFNLQLREIDGSMDVDALIKDAERWRKHWPAIREAYKYMANESDNAELHAAIDAAMADPDDDFTRGEHDL